MKELISDIVNITAAKAMINKVTITTNIIAKNPELKNSISN
jgi:hypothetical protein